MVVRGTGYTRHMPAVGCVFSGQLNVGAVTCPESSPPSANPAARSSALNFFFCHRKTRVLVSSLIHSFICFDLHFRVFVRVSVSSAFFYPATSSTGSSNNAGFSIAISRHLQSSDRTHFHLFAIEFSWSLPIECVCGCVWALWVIFIVLLSTHVHMSRSIDCH